MMNRPQRPLKRKVSISLDEPLLEELYVLADKADRNLSSYINSILKRYVETKNKPLSQKEDASD